MIRVFHDMEGEIRGAEFHDKGKIETCGYAFSSLTVTEIHNQTNTSGMRAIYKAIIRKLESDGFVSEERKLPPI